MFRKIYCFIFTLFFAFGLSSRAAILLDSTTLEPDGSAFDTKSTQAPSWEKKYKLVQVNTLIGDAKMAFEAGDPDKAIEMLERADKLAKSAPGIHRAIMQVLLATGKKLHVLERAKIAREVFPEDQGMKAFLGDVYLSLGHLHDARVVYDEVARADPTAGMVRIKLGRVLYEQGREQAAEDEFRALIKTFPTFAEAHYSLGALRYDQKQYKAAVESYTKAVQLQAGNAEYVNALGAALFEIDRKETAIKRFREAIKYDPGMAKAHRNLGIALMSLKLPDAALDALATSLDLDIKSGVAWEHFLKAMKQMVDIQIEETLPQPNEALDPASKGAWCHKAGTKLLAANRPVHAASYFIQAIQLDSGKAAYLNDLGSIIAQVINPGLGGLLFRGALLIDPNHVDAQVNLNRVVQTVTNERIQQQIVNLNEALFKRPDDAQLHRELGMQYVLMGQLTNAVPHFAKAVHYKSDSLELQLDYIQALFRAGQQEQAVKQCQKALSVLPENPELQYRLAWLIMANPEADDLHLFYGSEQLVKACDKMPIPRYLALLAELYQRTDRREMAVDTAAEAVDLAEDAEREAIRTRLSALLPSGRAP